MVLLDTNILSEFVRRRPDPRVVDAARGVAAGELVTSSVCVMELRYGSSKRPDSAVFWKRIEREILSRVRILPFDAEIARAAGDVIAELESSGQTIGVEDAQIGATALVNGAPVVTSNVRHFERITGLRVENWKIK